MYVLLSTAWSTKLTPFTERFTFNYEVDGPVSSSCMKVYLCLVYFLLFDRIFRFHFYFNYCISPLLWSSKVLRALVQTQVRLTLCEIQKKFSSTLFKHLGIFLQKSC